MATLNIVSIGQTGAQFYISGLTYLWDTDQYSNAYVTTSVGTTAPVYAPAPVGSGYSTSFGNITGLTQGTIYTATGWVVTSSNSTVNIGSVQFTTQSQPAPSPVTGVGVSSISQTSALVSWTNGANTSSDTVYIAGVNTWNPPNGASSQTVSGLSPNTSYTVIVTPYGNGSGTSGSASFTTLPNPPSGLTGLTASGNNGYVHLSWNASSGATSYSISWTGYSSGSSSTSGTTSDVFLTNNHSYTFTVTPTNSGGSGSSQSASASPSDRPSNFAWTTAKVSGQNFALTYQEWSSFTNTINGFRAHVGLGSYSFTTPTQGNPFYAYMFNQAVTAISAMSPPTAIPSGTASTKNTNDNINAAYLNDLVTSLNSIT